MHPIDIINLRQWLSGYCRRFYSEDIQEQQNIVLKEKHTQHVAANMLAIANTVLRDGNKLNVAEAIALLHDIGRFPQYARYKTFRDSISVNHGRLGAEVIAEEKVLEACPLREQEAIIDAVRFHNAFSIPENLEPETVLYLRMVRDADKLDIWRVFTEYYEKNDAERESAAGLGLPDMPGYSEKVLAALAEGKIATLSDMKSLNDFRIMQITWVFDLNFPVSFRLAIGQGRIHRIMETLPAFPQSSEALMAVKRYMQEMAAHSDTPY